MKSKLSGSQENKIIDIVDQLKWGGLLDEVIYSGPINMARFDFSFQMKDLVHKVEIYGELTTKSEFDPYHIKKMVNIP